MLDVFSDTLHRLIPEIAALRHEFHQHPELRFEERWTAERVAAFLHENGIDYRAGLAGGTGLLGTISGGKPGKTVLLRADMDALPITEQTGLPYTSLHPNRMHACGHDGHMAILCAAAKTLAQHRAAIHGTVLLLFQPAEEQAAGGRLIVQEGCLDGVDAVFALHGWPSLPLGKIGLRTGCAMASADFFRIDVHGKGGHAADPGSTIDPLIAAAHIVLALQTIGSREIDPWEPVVVTVAHLESGRTANVIPCHAWMEGTFRTLNRSIRDHVQIAIARIAQDTARAFRASADVTFDVDDGYPPLINDPIMTDFARETLVEAMGGESVADLPHPFMAAEDFSYYLERVPGTFMFLGTANPESADPAPLHTPHFDFNDDALFPGALALSAIAWRFLNRA